MCVGIFFCMNGTGIVGSVRAFHCRLTVGHSAPARIGSIFHNFRNFVFACTQHGLPFTSFALVNVE